MANDPLSEAGLHYDELNKLRILEPDVGQKTTELKEECKDFVDKIGQFQKIVGGLIEMVDELSKEAETEKLKAIGARNMLKSVAKQREAQQQQLQALIAEKRMQLERRPSEYLPALLRLNNKLLHQGQFRGCNICQKQLHEKYLYRN
ncbi:intraflagellar transport protein 20 homolog isoform X1 [Brachyhypopomus gauderio]|uniref:intraflagellar transport protein 20 homolog isoform X1 n=1 Tax=Brachyhypopomus gauderio TaxID=698409 RepID=UPI004041C84A